MERVEYLHMRVICLTWRWRTQHSTNPCHRTLGGYVCPLSSTASALRQSSPFHQSHWTPPPVHGHHAIDKAGLWANETVCAPALVCIQKGIWIHHNTQNFLLLGVVVINGIGHPCASSDLSDEVPARNDSFPSSMLPCALKAAS